MEHYHPGLAEDAHAIAEMDGLTPSAKGRPRPRRHDDEDEGSDILEDDDLESTVGGPTSGNQKDHEDGEEEKELPSHACA